MDKFFIEKPISGKKLLIIGALGLLAISILKLPKTVNVINVGTMNVDSKDKVIKNICSGYNEQEFNKDI